MRTLSCLAVVAGLFCAGYAVRARYRAPTPPAADFPPVVDLGDRDLGEQAVARFRFANRGDSPLVIDKVGSTCSCAGIEQEVDGRVVPVKQLIIPPRSEVELTARVAVRGAVGQPARSVISFRTNDPNCPGGAITVDVPRILGIACSPGTVLFNAVSGREAGQVIEVRSVGTGRPRLVAVASGAPELVRAELLSPDDPPPPDPTGSWFLGRVAVTLLAQSPGSRGGEVLLTVEAEGRTRVISVPVTATTTAPVTVSPAVVSLPLASRTGPLFEAVCSVRTHDGGPVLVRAGTVPAGFTVAVIDPSVPAPNKLVRVRWSPPAMGGQFPQTHTIELIATAGSAEYRLAVEVLCSNPEAP